MIRVLVTSFVQRTTRTILELGCVGILQITIMYTLYKINSSSCRMSALQVLSSTHFSTFVLSPKFRIPSISKSSFPTHIFVPSYKISHWPSLLFKVDFHNGSLRCYHGFGDGQCKSPQTTFLRWEQCQNKFLFAFIESFCRLVTKLGAVVVCPPKSWKPPPTWVSDDQAVTVRS